MLALEPDSMAHPCVLGRIQHPPGLLGIPAERPFAIDVLAGLDRRDHRPVVVGHLHRDRHQVDIRVSCQFLRVGKRQRYLEMPGRRLGRFLPGRAHRGDLEVRQRPQRRDMGDRREPPVRAQPDDPDADPAAGRHRLSPHRHHDRIIRSIASVSYEECSY